ncbi:uncharacterized protein BDCG_02941 [Blastomyces dermatitidis ER-3]|uniref:Uncharacterized protein n=2 Tax=Blastomyces TaxID=229219 RepID=A0A179UGI9_BLAGS|nr:uncharacterized protein BDBG_02601 [Blastomyces gilchristii SLH14081]XP_045275074.1 uncharacterized protein BDCG_02941 [Blastomyces dermatitidis ER-3]EEQ87821.2 hypothetical protein BDCG_02941 [Blastomyces dermatitidis ER-3]OAT06388.1 hypothetical protein BDBG_02601 [Blastomyces gilchristii SLH14081]
MGSPLPENNNESTQTSHTERVNAGDEAADEVPGSSRDANARRRLPFGLLGRLFGRRERHQGNGVPSAERRAAEQLNLQLTKVASLTGVASFQRPIADSDANIPRRFQAPQASRDYTRCIRHLSLCTDSESEYQDAPPEVVDTANDEPDIHPLRMHPVDNNGQQSRPASVNDVVTVAEVVEESPGEPETASVAEASSEPTTDDNNNTGVAEGSASNNGDTPPPPDQEDVAADVSSYSHSDTCSVSVYAEDWFPFRELAQISWRLADQTPEDESLPPTPKSPYRMGRARRYGWVEGQPF